MDLPEPGAGWLGFFRDLVARGPTGVRLVTSDAHAVLAAAVGATLPGATWQRCRTHYAANLMAATPKSSWGWVKALPRSVSDQPDSAAVNAQFDRVLDSLLDKLPHATSTATVVLVRRASSRRRVSRNVRREGIACVARCRGNPPSP